MKRRKKKKRQWYQNHCLGCNSRAECIIKKDGENDYRGIWCMATGKHLRQGKTHTCSRAQRQRGPVLHHVRNIAKELEPILERYSEEYASGGYVEPGELEDTEINQREAVIPMEQMQQALMEITNRTLLDRILERAKRVLQAIMRLLGGNANE